MPINYVTPIMDESVRDLCKRPYGWNPKTRRYSHPKGCPNWGRRDTCPPKAVLLPEFFDMTKPILAVWVAYDLASHRKKAKAKHPDWSNRQCGNSRHWQNGVLARLRREVKYNLERSPLFGNSKNLIATDRPEAMGVNVTETMKNVGVILEWPPVNIVRKIAFIGTPQQSENSNVK